MFMDNVPAPTNVRPTDRTYLKQQCSITQLYRIRFILVIQRAE